MTQLHPTRFTLAEYRNVTYTVEPEQGTPFEAVLKPEYWAHVAQKLRVWDRIMVRAEDGTYWGELLVINCGHLYARVHVLKKVELGADATKPLEVLPAGYEVKFQGPKLKWVVLRGADRLAATLESEHAAQGWVFEHIKSVKPLAQQGA